MADNIMVHCITEEGIRQIRALKTHQVLPTPYIFEFEKEWNEVVDLLVGSKADLSKIKLVEKVGK